MTKTTNAPRRNRPALPGATLVAAEHLEGRVLFAGHAFFVAPYGSDTGAGTADHPFKTIQAAANVANAGDTVLIHGGTYRETVVPTHSGTPGAPITFAPYGDGTVVVSGADLVTGLKQTGGSTSGTYRASQSWDLGSGDNQVFEDGVALTEARWPNTSLDLSHPTWAVAQSDKAAGATWMGKTTSSTLSDPSLTQPAGFWVGATITVLPGHAWVAQTGKVVASWPGGLTYVYQQMNVPYALPSAGDRYFLTAKPGSLDAAGEWSRDPATGTLSVWTAGGDDPANHTIEAKRRQYAFKLNSRSNITVRGLEIFAATIGTNVLSNNITLDGLDAKYVSQFAPGASGWNEPGLSGIQVCGHNDVLKNSLVEFSAGNGVFIYGTGNAVTNCVIHDVDTSATVCAGIEDWGTGARIQGNTIYNAGRCGINLSSSHQTLVLGNLIHDVMLQTTDGGGIYAYGSDGTGGEIADNRIFNVHSAGFGAAGLYLDNGCTHFLLDHNVVTDCDWGLKLNPPSHNNKILDNVLASNGSPLDVQSSKDLSGTVFAGNVYNGHLTISRGGIDGGNFWQAAPAVCDPSNGGAHVDTWAITPSVRRPSPRPTPAAEPKVVPTPTPEPAMTTASSASSTSNSGAKPSVSRSFLTWKVGG